MCTAHVFAPMLGVAGTSAEFGLAPTATVILAGTAVSMKIVSTMFSHSGSCKFTRERSSTFQSGR